MRNHIALLLLFAPLLMQAQTLLVLWLAADGD